MLQIALYLLAGIYPVLVFCCLVILKIPLRYFSIFVVFIGFAVFFLASSKKKSNTPVSAKDKKQGLPVRVIGACLLAALGLACLLSNQALFLKLYPVLMNAVMLGAFGLSLFVPPPMIFRFAVLMDKSIRGSLAEKRIERYCRKVTLVWCAFFVMNGGIAAYTVFSSSDILWSVYNGGISYILIGVLFAGEFLVRKITDKKMPRAVPLSQFKAGSRSRSHIICYERLWRDGSNKTWADFLEDTARLRMALRQDMDRWMLCADDNWYFLCAFTALLQCNKEIYLGEDASSVYLSAISEGGKTGLLGDQAAYAENSAGPYIHIPSLLAGPLPQEARAELQSLPLINAEQTQVFICSSPASGQTETVKRRLSELENDAASILSQYGEEWLSRKVCTTVSPNNIYGLLYAVLLPFTAGVPFRRCRIETPEEFELAETESLMIITAPEFLEAAVQKMPPLKMPPDKSLTRFNLNKPWIFTSGGALEKHIAERSAEVFDFLPVDACFAADVLATRGLSRIDIIEQAPERIIIEFSVTAESDYFNEHFPALRILPAVAQFELATRLANRYLHSSLQMEYAKRLKFSALIRPGVPLRLELSKSSQLISFSYSSPDRQTVYSSGTFSAAGGKS